MDLFSEETDNILLKDQFDPTWWNVLFSFINNSSQFDELLLKIEKERLSGITIYPDIMDTFKVFKLCPLPKVKVVILGQDPYHNGNADGIAFSCKKELSPSLSQLYFAMAKDLNIQVKGSDLKKDLTYLVEQGVFLLNTILTVKKGQPLSHKGYGWEYFIVNVFKALNRQDHIIWMLWGAEAQRYTKIITNGTHSIFISEHPAKAAREERIWTVDHFSECNKILKMLGKEEIQWMKTM